MLANLDNEVHFKKVFTNVEVFTAFVKDILGIDIEIDIVETEKVLPSKVSAIRFRMDLFAEDKKKRIVIEIQKVDYDYSYDRFAHYFSANLVEVQRKSEDYSYAREVYVIVVVTSPYKISDKNGKPIKEEVMVTDINPRNLQGSVIEMNNHKLVILNTAYVSKDTPAPMLDWLNLIRESMRNPERPTLNTKNAAIVKAAQLAEKDEFTPEQLAEAKIQEMKKKTVAVIEQQTAEHTEKRVIEEKVRKALLQGKLSVTEIAELFDVSTTYIQALADDVNNI